MAEDLNPVLLRCAVCGEEKSAEDFRKRSDRSRGREYICRSCVAKKEKSKRPFEDIRAAGLAKRIEAIEPEKAADFMLLVAHPDISLKRACEKSGIPQKAAEYLWKRLRTEYLPVLERLRKYQTADFLALIEDRLGRALECMDDRRFAKAELRDLAVASGILAEKRQLLRGEPTGIFSVEDRRRLTDLIPLLLEEARRRGETIELNPGEYSSTDGPEAPSARVRPCGPDTGEPIQKVRQLGGKILRDGKRNARNP